MTSVAWYEPLLLNAITLADTSVGQVAKTIARSANVDFVLAYDPIAQTWSGRRIDDNFVHDLQTKATEGPASDITPLLVEMPWAAAPQLTSMYRANRLMGDAHDMVVVAADHVGVYEARLSSGTTVARPDRSAILDLVRQPHAPDEEAMSSDYDTTTAWPLINCPPGVVISEPFEVDVGICSDPSDVDGTGALTIPPTSFTLRLELMAHGFQIEGPAVVELDVTDVDRWPVAGIRLTPEDDPSLAPRRKIGVVYRVADEFIGFAERTVEVTTTADDAAAVREPLVADVGMEGLDPDREPVDLEIVIKRGNDLDGGALQWAVDSRWTPAHDDAEATTHLGETPRSFRDMVLKKTRVPDPWQVYLQLVGIGKMNIAPKVPTFVKEAIDGALAELDRPPTLLLISDDPFVPWELAVLGAVEPDESPFLGAKVAISRWTGTQPRRPESEIGVRTIAVVSGDYQNVAGWDPLEHAANESAELTERWSAFSVDAQLEDVVACLRGDPSADIIHFALHGRFGEGETSNGLVLIKVTVDDRGEKKSAVYLDEAAVGGLNLECHPFVFLNACQVGVSTETLGEYSGLANGLLFAGARAVVAPLWSVDDGVAEKVALEFYETLEANGRVSAAEILRENRARVTEVSLLAEASTESTTRLAYQLFGHPGLSLRLDLKD